MTMRLPATGNPDFARACNPPAPMTLGSVQPGNGRKRSRAPVARIRLRYLNSKLLSERSNARTPGAGAAITRAPENTSTLLRSHGSGEREARQIWPPGRGLSSTMATRAPESEARAAAASPAGPAPMTATSNMASGIGIHLHARFARNLATLAMRTAVDGHAA